MKPRRCLGFPGRGRWLTHLLWEQDRPSSILGPRTHAFQAQVVERPVEARKVLRSNRREGTHAVVAHRAEHHSSKVDDGVRVPAAVLLPQRQRFGSPTGRRRRAQTAHSVRSNRTRSTFPVTSVWAVGPWASLGPALRVRRGHHPRRAPIPRRLSGRTRRSERRRRGSNPCEGAPLEDWPSGKAAGC